MNISVYLPKLVCYSGVTSTFSCPNLITVEGNLHVYLSKLDHYFRVTSTSTCPSFLSSAPPARQGNNMSSFKHLYRQIDRRWNIDNGKNIKCLFKIQKEVIAKLVLAKPCSLGFKCVWFTSKGLKANFRLLYFPTSIHNKQN